LVLNASTNLESPVCRFKNYEKRCQKAKKSMSIKEKDAQALLSTSVTEIELTHEGSEPVFDPELGMFLAI